MRDNKGRAAKVYQRILLAYNGFADSTFAARHAAELARFTDAHLHILGLTATETAIELAEAGGTTDLLEEKRKTIMQTVDAAVVVLKDRGLNVTAAYREGDPATEIVSYAYQIEADLCVLAHADKRSLARWIQSAAGIRLLAHLPCNLLIPRSA